MNVKFNTTVSILLITALLLISSSSPVGANVAANQVLATFDTFGVCYSQSDGTVFPIAGTCVEYIYCLSQLEIRLPCPVDQSFSKSAHGCISKSLSDCTANGPTVPPIEFSASNTCVDNEESVVNQEACRDQPFGELVPNPTDCNKFLVCNCLFPTVKVCPADLWFNNDIKTCDYPPNVDCVIIDATSSSSTSSSTTTIETTTPISTATTTTPTTPTLTIPTTTNSLETTTTTIITTSTDPTSLPEKNCESVTPPGIEDTLCDNSPDGTLYRYPYNCNAYVNCTLGCPLLNYCQPDKVFNQFLLICDTPDVAECEELPLPSTTTAIPTTTQPTTVTTEIVDTTVANKPPIGIDDDFCDKLANGFYAYPYDCNAYIICKDGSIQLDYCQDDKVYNPILRICDLPGDVECNPLPYPDTSTSKTTASVTEQTTSTELTTTTTTTTTTEIATTTTLPPDIDNDICHNLPDNTILPYAGNCAYFIRCLNSRPHLNECPSGLLFNPDLLICDNADDVVCYGDRSTTAQVTESTTELTTASTASGVFDKCAGQPIGQTYPYPEDCKKYYYCQGNDEYTLLPCPKNNWYNPHSGNCGPDVSPVACLEPVFTTPASTTQRTTMSPEELCASAKPGTTYPIETNCQEYLMCSGNGNSVTMKCPANNWYNPSTGRCGPDVSPTACQETESDSTTKSTTELAPTTSTPSFGKGICDNSSNGDIVAYPNDCSKYIVCVEPIPVAFKCQNGYYFSSHKKECVPWSESDCESISTTAPATTTPNGNPPAPTICTNATRDTFPYPDNCHWYIRCINDYVFMIDVCDANEYYDPWSGECGANVSSTACTEDYNQSSTTSSTSSSSSSTTEIATTAITRPPPLAGPCDDVPDGKRVPYPYDCTKFIQCESPIPVAYDCRAGLEFSAEEERCMSPSYANCTITTTPSPNVSSTETTTITTSSTEPPAPGGPCTNKPEGALVPYPQNCSKYIVCENPIPVGYDCPENLEFSPDELKCMQPDLANCYSDKTTATPTTSSSSSVTPDPIPTPTVTTADPPATTTPATTTLSPDTPNICCGQPLGTRLPYPDDCSKYVVCAYPIPYTVDCAAGTTFDESSLECSASQTGCKTSSNAAKPQIINASDSCSGLTPGTPVEYKGDCTRYMLCFGEQSAILECGNSWYFNSKMKQCVPPAMYQCPW